MKKIITAVCVLLALGLCGCGNSGANDAPTAEAAVEMPETEPTVTPTPEPTVEATEEPETAAVSPGTYEAATFHSMTFERDAAYDMTQSDESLAITYEPQQAVISITAVDISGYEDIDTESVLSVGMSSLLSSFETQEEVEGDATIGGLPAKTATCFAKVNETWMNTSISVVSDQKAYSYSIIFMQSADNASEAYIEDFGRLLETIQFTE